MNAFAICSRLRVPSVDELREITHSVAGRLGYNIAAELAGSWLGKRVIRIILEDTGEILDPSISPFANEWALLFAEALVISALSLKIKNGWIRGALGISLASAVLWTHLQFKEDPETGVNAVRSVAQNIKHIAMLFGENFGGFLGLAGASILFNQRSIFYWDPLNPENCYAVSMVRYQAMGQLYEMLVNPTHLVFKPFTHLGGVIVKTVAYNSNLVIPFLEKVILLVQKKKAPSKILEPFLAQIISRRFLDSIPISFEQSHFRSIFVSVLLDAGKHILANTPGKAFLGDELSEIAARLVLRGLQGYLRLIRSSKEILNAQTRVFEGLEGSIEELNLLLRDKIYKKDSGVQQLYSEGGESFFSHENREKISSLLVQQILLMEKKILGIQLLNEKNQKILKTALTVHLDGFFNYLLLNITLLIRSDLEPIEDMQLMWEMNHIILAGYLAFILPSSFYHQLQLVSHAVKENGSELARCTRIFIYRGEQTVKMNQDMLAVEEGYLPAPMINAPVRQAVKKRLTPHRSAQRARATSFGSMNPLQMAERVDQASRLLHRAPSKVLNVLRDAAVLSPSKEPEKIHPSSSRQRDAAEHGSLASFTVIDDYEPKKGSFAVCLK